jgi:histidinol-phosphate aminotransferase
MLQPNPNILRLTPAVHGGFDFQEFARLGIRPQDVIDFSVSTNPFGPPPGLWKALSRAPIDSYPDSDSRQLKDILATKLAVKSDNILIGSGSTELIRLAAWAYFAPRDFVLILRPTYSDYEVACQIVGVNLIERPLLEQNDFRLEPGELADLVLRYRPKAVFLCNPNNPTGQYADKKEITQALSAAPDTLIVIDEAYIAFAEGKWSSVELIRHPNALVLRSMTKDYGLAGLRLGYALASQAVISALRKVKPPWNVSSLAQQAGTYVLQDEEYLASCRSRIQTAKEFLIQSLGDMQLKTIPSQANFFMVKVTNARKLRQTLLQKGFLVRDCTSFGLPGYIRLAPRTLNECKKLVAALRDVGVKSYAG